MMPDDGPYRPKSDFWPVKRWGGAVLALGLMAAASVAAPSADGWINLFEGKTLSGWKANGHVDSFTVDDGSIVCVGPKSHLFYMGQGEASFRNFELTADVKARPGANSGIYFHTRFQEEGSPAYGYEVQINNSQGRRTDGFKELKKTGSLYGVRNLYKALVKDDEWFQLGVSVRGNRIQIRLNGTLVVDYREESPVAGRESRPMRKLSRGTIALQCHDPDSMVFFRNLKLKPLPDALPDTLEAAPVVDDTYQQIMALQAANFPVVDLHVHLKGGMTIEQALVKSRHDGIQYGIAPNCGVGFPITNDQGICDFIQSMKGQPVYLGMQAEGREWVKMFSPAAIAQFDYVFSDAMTFTDPQGRRVRLWMPEEVHIDDKQAFMDLYVGKIVGVIRDEPIDIYVNPTFLPAVIAGEYDALWTPERMDKVIQAAVDRHVAIEINARYRLPSKTFVRRAKQAGIKFTFGTNNGDADFGRVEYCLDVVKECGLTGDDMFVPERH
jgi:hypothetical protein